MYLSVCLSVCQSVWITVRPSMYVCVRECAYNNCSYICIWNILLRSKSRDSLTRIDIRLSAQDLNYLKQKTATEYSDSWFNCSFK